MKRTERDTTSFSVLAAAHSLDRENFLEFDARSPIVLCHLVLEVLLQGIDTVSRDHRHDLVLIVEVTSEGH